MSTKTTIVLFIVFSLLFCCSSSKLDQDRPNIIYINADDLGWTDLGCQGSKFYETPNINRLASGGISFTNAYAPASNCAPSRACCLTGQYTPRHGVYTVNNSDRGKSKDRKLIPVENTLFIQDNNITFAEVLNSAGYKTCTIGKWHISQDPTKNGFEINIAGSPWGHPKHGYFSPYKMPGIENGPDGEYLTDRLTNEAINFINNNKGGPFFLYLPYYTVHTPIQGKPGLKEQFEAKGSSEAHKNAGYAAMIKSLDENIGRILSLLDELDLLETTLIVFSSDNGGHWDISKQWPLRAGKGSYYEGGIRVPLIFHWPTKIKSGTICETPVSGIDFFSTISEAANVQIPLEKKLDGQSLIPLLTEKDPIKERPLFWHFPIYLQGYVKQGPFETRDNKFRTRPGSVIRYGDWKLHEYFEDNSLELYNLKTDIGEQQNLAESHPEKREELYRMLKKWRDDTGAQVPGQLNPEYNPGSN